MEGRKNKNILFGFIFFLFVFGFLAIFINSNDTKDFNLQHMGIEAIVERNHIYVEGSWTPELQPRGDTFFFKGHIYAAKQPGQFFVGSLAYFFLHKYGITYLKHYTFAGGLVTLFTSVLMTAILTVLVFKIILKITENSFYAILTACFFGFGTIIFPYSGVTHHDIYATFLSFLSFYLLFYRYRIIEKNSYFIIALSGFCLGFMFFFSLLPLTTMVVSFFYILFFKRWLEILLFAFFLIVGLMPTFIFNFLIFDGPFNFPNIAGNFSDTFPGFSMKNIIEKLYFYLLSPTNAIIFYSPIFIVSLLGFVLLTQKYFIEKVTLPFAFFFLLIHLSTMQTVGHSQFGPRYLLPSMPFVLVGLSGFFVKEKNTVGEFISRFRLITHCVVLVGIISIIICTVGSIIGVMYHTIYLHAFPVYVRKIVIGDLPVFHFIYFGIYCILIALILCLINKICIVDKDCPWGQTFKC